MLIIKQENRRNIIYLLSSLYTSPILLIAKHRTPRLGTNAFVIISGDIWDVPHSGSDVTFGDIWKDF